MTEPTGCAGPVHHLDPRLQPAAAVHQVSQERLGQVHDADRCSCRRDPFSHKVSFLEMYATIVGERKSKVGKTPSSPADNMSEYAYLFSMVMAGIADSEEHERLFLLPNAARRVLEVFASYKAPHRTDFLQAAPSPRRSATQANRSATCTTSAIGFPTARAARADETVHAVPTSRRR